MFKVRKNIILVSTYVIIAFLTFGIHYNYSIDRFNEIYPLALKSELEGRKLIYVVDSFLLGAIWPIYWGAKIGIFVTS